ncbi:ATP-binding protein [Flavobacterium restrictum]|uniref:ATP-binding protein n=1 Tax=Flavobacterium restrictum TaxID=2594428 RepID=A0A553DLD5_9FLAO|nr:ATP-binding protein [Flavobacterium restrictum]TRX33536.1 ATP-binding protein [Flavobacterium restrictum]
METGIHPNVDLKKADIQYGEREMIKHFAKLFSVSFAKSHNFKGTWYNFAFLKPTKDLREKYRFQNEMLLIINSHDDFDNRTFDYVDKLMFEYHNRLDKLCLILISKDNNIKKKIKLLSQQNPETRIIIPFSYVDFYKNSPVELIQQRLKEFFYGRDLFAFESPLQNDAYFYGRTETVQFFYDKYKSGENSGLFGLRKIGKTSVLYALKRYLNLRGETTVFIDCQEPAFHKRRWFECLEFIIGHLVIEIQERTEDNIDIKLNSNYTEKDASTYFEEDLKILYKLQNQNRILIFFDEIENITFDISPTNHWRKENDFIFFWQSIRAVYQKNPNLFSFIIAGVNPKTIETGLIGDFDNPIYRMITPTYLKLFNHTNVEDMVKNIGNYMGLDFDSEIYTFLTDDFGGHPFLIRQVCSKIHQEISSQRPQQVTKFFYKEKIDEFNKYLSDYVELIIDVLKIWYPNEYKLLESLVIGDYDEFTKLSSISDKPIIHLLGYNLIEKSDSNKYHIKINAVKNYILVNTTLLNQITTIEDKWTVITTKRNQLEIKIRNIVKLAVKSKYGVNKCKTEFLKIVEEKRRERLNNLNINEIFSDKSEIYFNDLKTFISKNWSDFENIFLDKSKFDIYMDLCNSNRIDAHAKDINEEDLTITLASLNWLNEKCDAFLD